MDRRKFLLGSTAAGTGLLFGTSAFSAAGSEHAVSIETGDGYLHVEPNDEYSGTASEYVNDNSNDGDPLELTIHDINEHGWVRFDDLLRVTNTGTQNLGLYVEDSELLGEGGVLDYLVDGKSIVGASTEDTDVVLEGVGTDDSNNSLTVTVKADMTDYDDELPEEDPSVMFVAEAGIDGATGGLSLDTTVPSSIDVDGDAALDVTLENMGEEPHATNLTVVVGGTEMYNAQVSVDAGGTWTDSWEIDTSAESSVPWSVSTDDEYGDAEGTVEVIEGGGSGDDLLDVGATDAVTVGSDNDFAVTATVSDGGVGGGEATAALDIDGDQLSKNEKTVTVPEGGDVEATFEVPTVYNDLAPDNTEAGRHGDFRFDGTEWTVTVDYGDESSIVNGTLDVEDGPIEFYDPDSDTSCAVCGMMTKGFESAHAQATHTNGDRMEFCSSGCLVTYVVDPGKYDGDNVAVPDASIEGAWVVDYTNVDVESGSRSGDGTDLIDAREASFVLDYSSGYGTMGANPRAFASASAAEDYVGSHDGLGEADIVTMDEFDDQIASKYRSSFQ